MNVYTIQDFQLCYWIYFRLYDLFEYSYLDFE